MGVSHVSAVQPGRRTSVLVVDDHRLIRDGLASAFRESGMHVAGAFATGEAAVECARAEEVGVAVVDLLLEPEAGGLSGLEVIRHLRGLAHAPAVLVLSSVGDHQTRLEAQGAGASAYLHKRDAGADYVVKAVDSLAKGEGMPARLHLKADARADGLDAAGLTPREREVLAYVAAGASNIQIAALLDISERTVKAHVSALYRKLQKDHRTELALMAIRHGLRAPHAD